MHYTPALGYHCLQRSLLVSSAHTEAGSIFRLFEDIVAAIGRQVASGIQAACPCEAHKGRSQQSGHTGRSFEVRKEAAERPTMLPWVAQ